jgi:hypothetical protein
MFLYLLIALGAGGGAGWLLRNQAAAKREDDMQRTVNETKARLPQFESLMRGRDDQIKKLKYEIEAKQKELSAIHQSLRDAESDAREKGRELKTVQHRNQALETQPEAADDSALMGGAPIGQLGDDGTSEMVEEYRRETERLKAELKTAKLEVLQLDAMQGVSGSDANPAEVQALEARLKEQKQACDQAVKALDNERGKVAELERQRELQNKSLEVLHQQLEIERERSASGRANTG